MTATVDTVVNTITFELPGLPISHNLIYRPKQTIHGPRWTKSDAWYRWVSEKRRYVPKWRVTAGSLIRVDAVFHYSWFYKNGQLRRIDTLNMLKPIADLVFDVCRSDDMYVKAGSFDSRSIDHDTDPYVSITLTEIAESEWKAT